ncbi:hypothetical protein HY636_05915 [Candidatus Woesearchaeota archaeon]|nr:hypothetical protein [Candidatus Woesearchaeota archaeon]
MQRTNTRLIKLPALLIPDVNYTGDSDSAEELNVKALDYVRRTAISTLDDFVITPFSDALKNKTFEEAKQNVGVDAHGILLGTYVTNEVIGSRKYVVRVCSQTRVQYETVFSLVQEFLEKVLVDNVDSVNREFVRKVDDEAHIFIGYLLDEMSRLCGRNSTKMNKKDLEVKYPATDEKLELDNTIIEMEVALDSARFTKINEKNADDFHKARSLTARLGAFKREFEKYLMEKYGVEPQGVEENEAYDYELSDGTGVRYLFFKKRVSPSYGDAYSELVTTDKVLGKTKNITKDYGDLSIVRDLAFKAPYQSMRAGAGIQIRTDITGSNKGVVVISRIPKGGEPDEKKYQVFDNDGKTYMRVHDVLNRINSLIEYCSTESTTTEKKIDFFAALPQHLK